MAALATNSSLTMDDMHNLQVAAKGGRQALQQVCERFQIPVLAVAVRESGDLGTAYECVEPVLRRLCRQLLAGELPPEDWSARLVASVRDHVRERAEHRERSETEEHESLSGLTSIPRVARRRAIRALLPQLPLAELIAILLLMIAGKSSGDMVGLVADSENEVCDKIVNAQELILSQLRSIPSDQ